MPKKSEIEEIGQPVLFYSMSDRDAAEEAKKNIIPPLIEVLEQEIEDSIERSWYAEMPDNPESGVSCLLLRAQLDAAKKDAEWKIQSFKIIDALTQRVAALEARLDAKETVPLGTPVLGSVPDSGEDSCEDSCEGAEEPVRRTLFPYW